MQAIAMQTTGVNGKTADSGSYRHGRRPLVLGLCAGLLALGCDDSVGPSPSPAGVGVSTEAVVLTSVGETHQLSAVVIAEGGDTIRDAEVAWSAADPAVVGVSTSGLLTARAPGTSEIVVRAGSAADTVWVDVQVATLGSLTSLASGLAWPEGLWISDGAAYFTTSVLEAGQGPRRLMRYDGASGRPISLVPTRGELVADAGDGLIHMASTLGLPGVDGRIMVVDPSDLSQANLIIGLGFQPTDLFADERGDLYVAGKSDDAGAPTLLRLPVADRMSVEVLERGLPLRAATTLAGDLILSNLTDGEDLAILRRSESGTLTEVSIDPGWADSMTTDGSYLYFAQGGLIGRFDPRASSPRVDTVISGLPSVRAIRYDRETESLYFLTAPWGRTPENGTLGVITGLR